MVLSFRIVNSKVVVSLFGLVCCFGMGSSLNLVIGVTIVFWSCLGAFFTAGLLKSVELNGRISKNFFRLF